MAYTPGDQDTIEILVKARMDIKQFESSLLGLERKMQVAQKELSDSLSKIAYIEAKTSKVVSDATRARLTDLKSIEAVNRQSIATYKNQTTQIEKQIAFIKELSREQVKAQMHANAMSSTKTTQQPFKMGSESTTSMNAAYATMESGSKTSTTSTWLQRLLGQHDELDKKMKQVDNTAKNSFPHKVSTTAQYMAAGAGIMLVTSSLGSMITAIIESDKAMGMFEAVLELNKVQATSLQKEIFTIGKTYGGTVQDLNESALALGRAGIAGKDLATSIQAVSQVALLSGDSLDNITQLLVSWKTVYPEEKMNALADSMVGVANATLLSMDDLKTVTTYMLTAGQQAGLTSDSLLALAGSWRQLGKAPSTVGTESRRFFEQITSGADDVKKAYKLLGINVDIMKKELAKGGPEAEAAMVQMFKVLSTVSKEEGQKSIKDLAGILDKATIQALLAMSRAGKDGITIYEKTLIEAGDKAEGSAKAGADKVALTYEKMWERIKNTLTQSSSIFGEALKAGFAGTDSTVGSFNEKMISLDRTLTNLASTSGKVFGTILQYTDEMVVAYGTYKAIVIGGSVLEALGLIKTGLNAAKTAQYAFNLAAMRNPYIIAGTAIVAGVTYFYNMLEDAQDKFDASQSKTIKIHEAASTAAGTTNGKIKSLDSSYKALNSAIEKNRVLLSKSSGTTKTGYENSIKSLEDQVKRNRAARAELTKNIPGSTKTPVPDLGAGNPELKGTKTTKASIESINKNLLDEDLQRIRLKEQQYFYDNKITSELEQQKYHVNTTLRDELKATEGAGYYKNKLEDALKIKVDIWKASRAIQESEYQSALGYSRKIEDLNTENTTIGIITDRQKLLLDEKSRELTIDRTREDLKHAGLYTSEQIHQISIQMLENSTKLTKEQERQLEIANRLRKEALDLTSLQIQASNATSGSEQIALEKQMIRQKLANEILSIGEQYKTLEDSTGSLQAQAIANARALADQEERKVEGAQSYFDLMRESNVQYQRQTTLAKGFFNVTQGAMGALQSGLTDYFQIGNEGYGKWSDLRDKLTKAILDGLMQELVIKQAIAMIGMATSSAPSWLGTAISVGMAYFGASDTSTTSELYDLPSNYDYSSMDSSNPLGSGDAWQAKGGINYLAKGGYVNSIISTPTYVAKGTIAGEAGAEAVMPLQRDSQGRLGVNTTGGASGTQNIKVEIINNSSEELKVTKSEGKFDGEAFVLSVVIDAIKRNKGGMKDLVGGSR